MLQQGHVEMQQGVSLVAGWVNRLTGTLGRKPSTPYKSFYELEATDIDGKSIDFNKFRGKARNPAGIRSFHGLEPRPPSPAVPLSRGRCLKLVIPR